MGEKQAEITDFVVRIQGLQTNTIEKGSNRLKMRIHFHESIQPIMAFTFKNIQGTEITGTNTMYEGVNVEHTDAGIKCVVVLSRKWICRAGNIFSPLDVPVIGMEILPYSIVYMMHAT